MLILGVWLLEGCVFYVGGGRVRDANGRLFDKVRPGMNGKNSCVLSKGGVWKCQQALVMSRQDSDDLPSLQVGHPYAPQESLQDAKEQARTASCPIIHHGSCALG